MRARQQRHQFGAADQADRLRVLKADRNALDGRISIERQPCRAGLGDPGLHRQ